MLFEKLTIVKSYTEKDKTSMSRNYQSKCTFLQIRK